MTSIPGPESAATPSSLTPPPILEAAEGDLTRPATGRPVGYAGKRTHVVAVRLSDAEMDFLADARGALTNSEYLRMMLNRIRRAQKGAVRS